MSPGRLTELHCPGCRQVTWVIDSDCRGMDDDMVPYDERQYPCASCGHDGAGWTLGRQSPPAFFLQPHDLYPMTQVAFDQWVEVLRTHFPTHPALSRLGKSFRPRLPEEAEAMRQAHALAHPVLEMRDQDGARRRDPDSQTAREWLEIMQPGDTLVFVRRDGGSLDLRLDASTFSARCLDSAGAAVAEAAAIGQRAAWQAIQAYLAGNRAKCIRRLRAGNIGAFRRVWRWIADPS